MRLLADENITREVIVALRAAGHDVVAIAETMRSAVDEDVLAEATATGRILITEDRDFGDLVVRRGLPVDGVVLLELHKLRPITLAARVVAVLAAQADNLVGHFTVVEPARVRMRPMR
jgi:predicted nuclease of predicted toxin-antitoxin system